MRVSQLIERQILRIVYVKNEQPPGIERVNHLDRRAPGVKVKTVEHQADIAAINFQHDFVGQLKSLHTAILLAQEFKGEPDAMSLANRSQLPKHSHRFFDHLIAAQAAGWKLAGNNYDVRTADRLGDRA